MPHPGAESQLEIVGSLRENTRDLQALQGLKGYASVRPQDLPEVVPLATSQARDITQLLRAWGAGDKEALDLLTPLVFNELHKSAKRQMARERDGHTLQTTALINEVYLRLVDLEGVGWQDRAHFFAICARLMRRILTDYARSRSYLKRGGDVRRVTLDEALMVTADPTLDLVALEGALSKLGEVDSRKSSVVELKFFGGLTLKEIAEVLNVSSDTVTRDWNLAKAWLMREMNGETRDGL